MSASTPDLAQLAQSIKMWGQELGFAHVGIAGVDLGEHEHHLQRWLDAGYQGEMEYLGAHGSKRSHPDQLIPGTVRVVSLRMDYLPGDTQMAQRLAQPEKAYVSRYALGRDYHKLVRKRVQFLADRIQEAVGPFGYRAFVDSAPVLEKALADQAGPPSRSRAIRVAQRVQIDNKASNVYTVVEVSGRDRRGLLHDITRAFADMGLSVASARIATYGARASDVFYVKDVFGLKVTNAGKLRSIEARLRTVLEGRKPEVREAAKKSTSDASATAA